MCACSVCKLEAEEVDLMWVELPSEHDIQIIWTGRGRGPSKEKKMELVCNECCKKSKKDN